MASTALVARGSTIGVGDAASPEVYTTIANIDSISGPGSTAADIEVTDLSSTAKEFLLDLVDNGTVTCSGFYNPGDTQHDQLRSDNAASTQRNYRITLSSSPQVTFTFAARVSEFTPEEAVAAAIRFTFTLRVTGAVTKA